MKKIITASLFISLFVEYAWSQPDSANYIAYYNLVNKGKYYAYIHNPDKAIPAFQKAFQLVPKIFAFDEFHLARCYAMKKDTLQVMHWLLAAIKDGFFYKYNKEARTDSLFDFLDKKRIELIGKADEDAFQYYHYNNVIEKKWNDSINYYFYNDAVFRSAHNKEMAILKGKRYIDSSLTSWDQLQEKAMKFLLKNGYPGQLRAPFTDIFGVVLLHFTVERKQKLKPFLFEELKDGNITPLDYAGFCEQIEFGIENTNCVDLYYVLKTDCTPSDWPGLINNRKSIGLSIYLDQGDYVPYQMKRRKELPWIDQVKNND